MVLMRCDCTVFSPGCEVCNAPAERPPITDYGASIDVNMGTDESSVLSLTGKMFAAILRREYQKQSSVGYVPAKAAIWSAGLDDGETLIVPSIEGREYEIQCGGVACLQRTVKGWAWPIPPVGPLVETSVQAPEWDPNRPPTSWKRTALGKFLDDTIGAASPYNGWCAEGLTAADADVLDIEFAGVGYPFRVDRSRLDESVEAFLWVKIGNVPAVLTWENCD